MILTLTALAHLAASCGPSVHIDTLASIAETESKRDTLAIHDNVSGWSYHPATIEDAIRLATDLIERHGHSTDLGLMQINSTNLTMLRLSIADAFDPCKSLGAGASVLVAGYNAPQPGLNVQSAILRAISRYNTGNADQGFKNGYVRRVQLAAAEIVPAIHVQGSSAEPFSEQTIPPPQQPPAPPPWDVFAQARFQQEQAAASRARLASPSSPPSLPTPTVNNAAPPISLKAIAAPEVDQAN